MMRTTLVFIFTLLLFGIGCVFSSPQTDPFPTSSEGEVSIAENPVAFLAVAQGKRDDGSFVFMRVDGTEEEVYEITQDIAPGMLVSISGFEDTASHRIFADKVDILEEKNIVIVSPLQNATVTSPLIVQGFGRVFENTIQWRLKDDSGIMRDEGVDLVLADEPGSFGLFRLELFLPAFAKETFTLEVFSRSPKDGSEQDLVVLPLQLLSTDFFDVQIYFDAPRMSTPATCELVYPADRRFTTTSALARAALLSLLEGPTIEEQKVGTTSNIPAFTILKTFIIQDKITTIDLFEDGRLSKLSDCEKEGMRAQIEKTLLSFKEIESVVILIDEIGR